jgi:tRNA G18 (ribose-2'-O)-methylase SpoU
MNKATPIPSHIRECANPACRFRFPVTGFDKNFRHCPKCGEETVAVLSFIQTAEATSNQKPERRITLVLDNLRSVFNAGSIFRSADGCGIVEHIYLCGTTPTPEHPKMGKTALGAERSIPWSYHLNNIALMQTLIETNHHVLALERTESSIELRDFLQSPWAKEKLTIVVGNEVTGVDPAILSLAKQHIHLPMHGIKESLNVAIAASIVCYSL